MEPFYYLPFLLVELKQLGVAVYTCVRAVDLAALGIAFDVVVNCSGLGSAILANDPKVFESIVAAIIGSHTSLACPPLKFRHIRTSGQDNRKLVTLSLPVHSAFPFAL